MPKVKVVVSIDELACGAVTVEPRVPVVGHNTRDEVYIIVQGDSSTGLIGRYLPAQDDYYEFQQGFAAKAVDYRTWTNKNQSAVGRPVLWAGEIDIDEGANIFAVIAEQDNRDLGELKRALQQGLPLVRGAVPAGNPLVDALFTAAESLIATIPEIDSHEVIGAFGLHLRNEGGTIKMALVPWQYKFEGLAAGATTTQDAGAFSERAFNNEKTQAITLEFKPAGGVGAYRGIVAARIVDSFIFEDQYELIGTEIDRCGERELYVSDRKQGYVTVLEGASNVPVDVPNNRFHWYCGAGNLHDKDKDWTTAPSATDRVLVSRGASRRIEWKCYRKVSTDLSPIAVSAVPLRVADTARFIRVKHSSFVLDVPGFSRDPGTRIQQFGQKTVAENLDNQLWYVVKLDDGYCKLQSKISSYVLDVADGSRDDGAPVNQYPWHGGYNQQWRIEPVNGGWSRIINRNSGKCLDIPDASLNPGVGLQQFTWNNQDNQLWRVD